jgi:redox-sensitive bicupin YhaK (pirin superfamily)
MITVRSADARGHAEHGWLSSHHTFSFANYYDPRFMGFRALRVINEDHIQGGTGFGPHPHQDMEIITYILEGALQHKDSMGNTAVIRPGEVQKMTAGTGVVHAEHNAQPDADTHLLQIWILPDRQGLKPGYEQKTFAPALEAGGLVLVASPDGRDGSIVLHQDATLSLARLQPGTGFTLHPARGRGIWVQVVRGSVRAAGRDLVAGDALAAEDEASLEVTASTNAEVMVFDLA